MKKQQSNVSNKSSMKPLKTHFSEYNLNAQYSIWMKDNMDGFDVRSPLLQLSMDFKNRQ